MSKARKTDESWYKGFHDTVEVDMPKAIGKQTSNTSIKQEATRTDSNAFKTGSAFALDHKAEAFIIDMMTRMKINTGDGFPRQLDLEKHIAMLNVLKWRCNEHLAEQRMSIPDQVQHPLMVAIANLFSVYLAEGELRGLVKKP